MGTLEDGAQFRPSRKPKFIPIEHISAKDVVPGFFTDSPKNPEEELLAKEERNYEEENEPSVFEERLFEELNSSPETSSPNGGDSEYAWDDPQQVTKYEAYVDKFAKDFESMEQRNEDMTHLLSRYHLKINKDKEDIVRWISMRASHGPRGREHEGKHQKGKDTIRKPKETE